MTIRRTRIACWIPKATDTHSEYVIHLSFPLQNTYTSEPQCWVYTYLASLLCDKDKYFSWYRD